MEVKVSYAIQQLEEAVKFIARNNKHFLGQTDYIREQIVEDMYRIAKDPKGYMSGTMGYLLVADREYEGIEADENTCRFDIYIDPALGLDYTETEYEEIVLNG